MSRWVDIAGALRDSSADAPIGLQQLMLDAATRLDWYEGQVHSCHQACQKPLCVAHRRIRDLETVLEKPCS